MRIAPKTGKKGLNDDGEECDITVMEEELGKFLDSPAIHENTEKSCSCTHNKQIMPWSAYLENFYAMNARKQAQNSESQIASHGC